MNTRSPSRTFSNWWTRNIPLVSRPCEPTSCRKQVDNPAYFIGSFSGSNQSPRWRAAKGCSLVAIRYFSSRELSSAFSLDLPMTCVHEMHRNRQRLVKRINLLIQRKFLLDKNLQCTKHYFIIKTYHWGWFTLYSSSSNWLSWATSCITSFLIKNGV